VHYTDIFIAMQHSLNKPAFTACQNADLAIIVGQLYPSIYFA